MRMVVPIMAMSGVGPIMFMRRPEGDPHQVGEGRELAHVAQDQK